MQSRILISLLILASVGTLAQPTSAQPAASAEKSTSRKFQFHYGAEITNLPPKSKANVWFPIASTSPQQTVTITNQESPSKILQHPSDRHGNTIGHFETTVPETGSFTFQVEYEVERHESKPYGKGTPLTETEKSLYLSANTLVPIQGRPLELIADKKLPPETMATGQAIYSVVRDHMRYDKSKPGYGNGDSVWACDSRFGNCTDFHSLFISLARSRSIPTKFEIGFPLPPAQGVSKGSEKPSQQSIGGYHCWAWFHTDSDGWVPVDISEADKHPELSEYYFGRLTSDRITMSVGRDIKLPAPSASGPLNYFVYPHVEIDGTVIDKKHISGKFTVQQTADSH